MPPTVPVTSLPSGVADVLAVLRSSAIVVDSADEVINNSPSATAYGLVKGRELVHSELRHLARQVRRDGVIRESQLELSRGPLGQARSIMQARVAPLGSSHVLLLVEDHTQARRVEEVRRDFVANVSHELKTPVGGLGLLAEAIQDAKDDPEAVERFASRMQVESHRLAQLVKEIVDLSRLQVADTLHEPRLVDVTAAVHEAIDLSRVGADAKRIEIAEACAPDLKVFGDEDLLVTAVRNLIGNAVAYSDAGTRVAVARPTGGRNGRDHRDRPGPGHPGHRAGPDLRTLLPRGRRPLARHRWHRARPGHRQAHLRQPRRRRRGVERGGSRVDLHDPPARRGRPHRRPDQPGDLASRAPGTPIAHRARSTTGMTRILVVEDEVSFSDPLSYLLRKEGYEVAVAETGPDALADFDRAGADLVLLDLMLPGLSGTEVCRAIRQRSSVPVIMLTAKDSEIDKVVGLEIGADDYVTKPYSSRELLARIKAVLRRLAEPEDLLPATIEAGPVRMDVERHIVTVSGAPTQMPLKEFELLEMLLRNTGRVLTRMQLIDRVWGSDYVGDTKTLDVHVKRLRAKIEPDPTEPRHIVTVRGLGYKFESD